MVRLNNWAQGYKSIFMLNSGELEILNAHKYENIKKIQHFSGSGKPRMLFFPLINVKMPTVVGSFNICEHEKFHAQLSPA